jgi:hypothetical protein
MAKTAHAQVTHYRERDGSLYFRLSPDANWHGIEAELKRRIPTWARSMDAGTREWRVKTMYRDVVEEVLLHPQVQTATVRRRTSSAAGVEQSETRSNPYWLALSLALIVAASAWAWLRLPDTLTSGPTPAEIAEAALAPLAEAPEVIAPGPLLGRVTGNANLRRGPGVTFEVSAQAKPGDSVTPVARSRAADGFWWLRLDNGAWVRSDFVVSADAGELPLDLSRLKEEFGVVAESAVASP